MNLFFKSYHFYLFFFFAFGLKPLLLLGINQATEIPVTLNVIELDIPAAYNQNPTVSFCRSHEGITFISKTGQLIVIDDDKVFTHPLSSPLSLSCAHHNNTAFLQKNNLGYISYNPFSGISLESILSNTSPFPRIFEPVNIACNSTHTFFATSEGIFADDSDSLQFFSFKGNRCKVFSTGEEIFAHVFSLGIFYWNGSGFDLVMDQDGLRFSEITSFAAWNSGWIMGIENQFLFFRKSEEKYIQHQLPPPFNSNRIAKFKEINEHKILFTDHENSLKVYDSQLQCTQSFRTNITLPQSVLKSIQTDQFHDLWLVFDFNVYKVASPGNSLSLTLSENIPGYIYSAGIQHGNIYLGTFNGLYKVQLESNCQYTLNGAVINQGASMHLLSGSDSGLYVAGNDGLFSINGNKIQKTFRGSFSFLHLMNENQLIARKGNTIIQYSKIPGKGWDITDTIENISEINNYTEHLNKLWLLTQDDVLISVGPEGFKKLKLKSNSIFEEKKLISYQQGLYLSSGNRLLKVDPSTGELAMPGDIPYEKFLNEAVWLRKTSSHYWIVLDQHEGGYTIYDLLNMQEGAPFFNITADNHFGHLVNILETETHNWFIGSRKIIRLVNSLNHSSPSKTLRIQSVTDFAQNKINESSRIKYQNNNLVFNLGDIRYKDNPEPYYRYKLSHYNEHWTDWSTEKNIEFSDLKERKYTFTAQSISHIGQLSEPVSFSFSVAPPIYRTWFAYIIYILLLLIIAFLLYKFHLMNLQRVEDRVEEKIRQRLEPVLAEKEKSDKLVEDLLPKATAEELKSSGRAKSKKFELVTVLFSDIQGFTRIAEEMNPEVLIDELDKFFFHFDSVVDKYNIEKIKTIGDAYMAAGGIPIKNSSNPVEVVLAGLEMQNYMNELKILKTDIWDLRIGIHTGPVISGVVGHKKLSYDIWGDTVNTASRMESSGEGGKVNISGVTYSIVKDYFICEYRGKLPVKYKGNIDMYFVTGLRPELSVDLRGIPNKRFFTKLQMLRLKDLEELIFEKLNIYAEQLVFHSADHLVRMVNQAELLARSENISEEDLLLLQTSAMIMYIGLPDNYENYENISIKYAQEILPIYSYSDKQIDRICNLILATKTPFNPQNLLERILIDAKMEYLGRSDYLANVKLQFEEMQNMRVRISRDKMIRQQEELLKKFVFHTIAAKRLREISVEEQIEQLKTFK